MDTITLKEVLDEFDAGAQFSIAFITADHHKKTGGEYVIIERAWKHNNAHTPQQKAASAKTQPVTESLPGKNPNHFENATRNIRLPNGEIRKVHIHLIRKYCGKTVL